MRTRDEIDAELRALDWKITDAPRETADGWKATIQRGNIMVRGIGLTAIGVLEDLLRSAKLRGGRLP